MRKIIDYCRRIEDNLTRFGHSYELFQTDYLFQDACCMCIVQIGELVGLLSEEIKLQNAQIPWRVIKDARNFYVHNYGSIDVKTVWETMTDDIPGLSDACRKILAQRED